ncbi:DNA repair protein RecO [Ornithinibacillus halophilus]|uniref:DNA repair protein RecO n=1 Tax=Ornithinibacillus halophilus TaxID=930117 RepID=A0A1M5DN12_9BACI|nr:DNA repair protein RecO [Ornithinibacillus halophilus]SHF68363.1 DNA replication and repair protein RecO [Ornithinibacillus halophilus]
MLEKIQGIIIKTRDYGETHKIVTIYSNKIGKFSAIAKGAKKTKSRMAAVTQPFIFGEFLVYINSGLSSIQQGDIIDSFRTIREDIVKTAYTAYISELTEKLHEEKEPDFYIFDQFLHTMRWIEEHDEVDIPIMMYELKLFKKGGFAPTVHHCVNCRSKQLPYYFSIDEGGFLCQKCKHLDDHAMKIPDAVAKLLNIFANVGLEQVGNISVKPENQKMIRKLMDEYYEQYGGFYLKTKRFLEQMNRLML